MGRGLVPDELLHHLYMDRDEMWELLQLPEGTPIKKIEVGFDVIGQQWHFWVDLYSQEELDEMRADDGIVV